MSPGQMAASGVNLGDWATVTSNGSRLRAWKTAPARRRKSAPQRTAGIGHNYLATYGNPQLRRRRHASIQGDCGSVKKTQ
jgi:hypothetical protein